MVDSFCIFRIKNELSSLFLLKGSSYKISYDPLFIEYYMCITSGIYKNKKLSFTITFPKSYPFDSPRIICKTKVYHPSIDKEGHVCLEILRLNWKCSYGIQNILVNLYTIFFDLECECPLNTEVYELMKTDYKEFVRRAHET